MIVRANRIVSRLSRWLALTAQTSDRPDQRHRKDYSCNEGFCPSFLSVTAADHPRLDQPPAWLRVAGWAAAIPASCRQGSAISSLPVSAGQGVSTLSAVLVMAARMRVAAQAVNQTRTEKRRRDCPNHRVCPDGGLADRMVRGPAGSAICCLVVMRWWPLVNSSPCGLLAKTGQQQLSPTSGSTLLAWPGSARASVVDDLFLWSADWLRSCVLRNDLIHADAATLAETLLGRPAATSANFGDRPGVKATLRIGS